MGSKNHVLKIPNQKMLLNLARRFPESVKIRALDGTPCLHQLAAAQRAARYDDLYAHVEVKGQHRAVPLWNETRVWDPGDYM